MLVDARDHTIESTAEPGEIIAHGTDELAACTYLRIPFRIALPKMATGSIPKRQLRG